MDTKALRQKILDLAIRGKLVPQDPSDEPASVLLERIREQKKQMVKEGKLKAKDIKNDTIIFVGEDNLHYEKFADGTVKCIEEEIPFEVPEGWEWTRLGNLSSLIQYGLSNSAEAQGTHRLLRITDIQDGKVNWKDVPFTTVENAENYLLRKDDIVFARTGATVGKSFLVTELPFESVYASYLIRIRLFDCISPSYLYQFFNSYCYWEQITDKSVGVGQPNCNGTSLKELFIPLPPLHEQKRIVPAANALLKYASVIESERASLQEIINLAKSKILDLAIRGKLVPPDPNDEPASVLLERIRAEKEELIRQGKIKRDKKESFIFRGDDNSYYEKIGDEIRCIDEELPFEIPDRWEWVQLENCCCKEIRRGKSPKYIEQSETLVFAQKCNTKYNGIDIGLAFYLDESTLNKYPEDEYMQDGDIVINSTGTGTLGRVGFYRATDNYNSLFIVPDSHVTVIRSSREIHAFYLFAFMKANQSELEKKGEGSTNQKELKPLTLKELYVPVPPYEEQLRIAVSINNAFSLISKLEKSLK
nr:MAG TPA: hypothetical protein [Bacteriophage sp.]